MHLYKYSVHVDHAIINHKLYWFLKLLELAKIFNNIFPYQFVLLMFHLSIETNIMLEKIIASSALFILVNNVLDSMITKAHH